MCFIPPIKIPAWIIILMTNPPGSTLDSEVRLLFIKVTKVVEAGGSRQVSIMWKAAVPGACCWPWRIGRYQGLKVASLYHPGSGAYVLPAPVLTAGQYGAISNRHQ